MGQRCSYLGKSISVASKKKEKKEKTQAPRNNVFFPTFLGLTTVSMAYTVRSGATALPDTNSQEKNILDWAYVHLFRFSFIAAISMEDFESSRGHHIIHVGIYATEDSMMFIIRWEVVGVVVRFFAV